MNARVNQKLYLARLLLDTAAASEAVLQTALLEAVLFHLVTAYRIYLHEIADGVVIAADSALKAAQQRQHTGLPNKPELDELALLESNGAWPAQLLRAYADTVAVNEPDRTPLSVIALTDITSLADDNNCRRWLDQFQSLLLRQREHAREY